MKKLLWIVVGSALIGGGVSLLAFHVLGAQSLPFVPRPHFGRQGGFQRGRLSPHESVSADVGGAHITVTYGRPSMRGRKIFGSLVRYDEVWCPGADEATTLDSSRDLQFGSLRVPSGPHTVWILPTEEAWTLIISQDPSGFHTDYHRRADLGRVELRKRTLPSTVEQLTFAIEPGANDGGTLSMAWEMTQVSADFRVLP